MWHRVAVEHTDEPGRWDDVVPVGESMPFPAQTPFFQCMTTGEPVLVPRISEQMGNAIAAQFEKRDISPLINGRSMLVVPLKARNVVLGFMILLRHRERADVQRHGPRHRRRTRRPRRPRARQRPDVHVPGERRRDPPGQHAAAHHRRGWPGCDIATRYLPGTLLGRVGGDWFDSIKLPGSRTALVVGDVMGHGLNSAAMMGQLRTAVQTMAALDLPPAQLLRNLDDLAQRLGEHYLATCLYAVYDPIESNCTSPTPATSRRCWSRAADGRSELLDLPTGAPHRRRRGALRGGPRAGGARRPAGAVHRRPGRGARRGHRRRARRRSASPPRTRPRPWTTPATRSSARSTPRGGRKDDVALLMARLNGIDPRGRRRRGGWPVDPREVGRARAWSANSCTAGG